MRQLMAAIQRANRNLHRRGEKLYHACRATSGAVQFLLPSAVVVMEAGNFAGAFGWLLCPTETGSIFICGSPKILRGYRQCLTG
jgi:hypothetical protein